MPSSALTRQTNANENLQKLPGSLIGRAQTKEELPTHVYAILINDVYSVLGAFAIGACTATLVGSIAAWRTHNLLLTNPRSARPLLQLSACQSRSVTAGTNPQSATTSARCAAGSDGMRSAPRCRGLPKRHVFCCSRAHRRLGQPPPAYLERGRFRCSYYRAPFQPAVDRDRPGVLHSLADRNQKCTAPRVASAVLSAITALYCLATVEFARYSAGSTNLL